VEYIKTVETVNFRITCQSVNSPANPPNSKDPVSIKIYGATDDGLRFCASPDALAMVSPSVGEKGLPAVIRAYELTLPIARHLGYLKAPVAPVAPVAPSLTPPPVYDPNSSKAPDAANAPESAKS
jgi:hypothetical protein